MAGPSSLALLIAPLCAAAGVPAHAQSPVLPVAVLRPPDGDPGQFGKALAVDGDALAESAWSPANSSQYPAPHPGIVHVFELSGGAWEYAARLEAPDPSGGAGFGTNLELVGDTLVVGWPYSDVQSNPWMGAVHVYERDAGGPGAWGEVQRLDRLPQSAGSDLELVGDALFVGVEAGVWGSYGSHWGRVERHSLVGLPADPGPAVATYNFPVLSTCCDSFGGSVEIAGDLMVVGAPEHFASLWSEFQDPAVYVWDLTGQQAPIQLAPAASPYDGLGHALAFDGRTIATASYGSMEYGSGQSLLHVFERVNGSWQEVYQEVLGPAQQSFPGRDLVLQGDLLFVSVTQSPKHVEVLRREGPGVFSHVTRIDHPSQDAGDPGQDGFGWSLAATGNWLAVGAPFGGPNHKPGGVVFVYDIGSL